MPRVLVFTPTVLNALIWNRAARFRSCINVNAGVPARSMPMTSASGR